MSFDQSMWMQPYIDHNTRQRQKAKTTMETCYWKMKSNAMSGKCIENKRRQRNIDFYLEKDYLKAWRRITSPYHKADRIIQQDKMILLEKFKSDVLLDKPIAVGVAVLELSKLHMLSFYYNRLLPKLGRKLKLAYTDTDSMVLRIKTDTEEEYYQMMADLHEEIMLGHSNIPSNHPSLRYLRTKDPKIHGYKILGMFKDEWGGRYSLSTLDFVPKCIQ